MADHNPTLSEQGAEALGKFEELRTWAGETCGQGKLGDVHTLLHVVTGLAICGMPLPEAQRVAVYKGRTEGWLAMGLPEGLK